MMDYQEQLKLQAYLDGELPEGDAREVANWLARDRDAVGLLAELRQTRKALSGFERDIRLPESGDFYWSKIRREIERLEPGRPAPAPEVSLIQRLRRFLVPATTVALLFAAGFLASRGVHGRAPSDMETADPGTFTYRDYANGATLVWLSYPSENEVADQNTTSTIN